MKTAAMCIMAITLCGASARAQKTVSAPRNGNNFQEATQPAPDALTKIFSNLGPSTSAYDSQATLVTGPTSALGSSQFVALSFSSKAPAHVFQLRAAIQWEGIGANQVNLSLYSDASGAPGTLLAGPITVKNLPIFFACCKVAIAHLPIPVAIDASTRYWVVADTPTSGTGSDFYGSWDFVPPKTPIGFALRGGNWFAAPATIEVPAGAVYGTIP